MRTLYVDESKARGYLLAGTIVAATDAPRIRRVINTLRLNGQSRIHMAKENDSRRRLILSRLIAAGVGQTCLWEVKGERQDVAREKCLAAAARAAELSSVDLLVIERDGSLVAADRATLARVARGRSPRAYEHREARSEPLLSIPDAVAWSHQRGGEWAGRCAQLICCVTRLQ